jgi:hypothetical protein
MYESFGGAKVDCPKVVGRLYSYCSTFWAVRVRILSGETDLSLLRHNQASSGAHMGTMDFFQATKRPGLEADDSPPSNSENKMNESTLSFPPIATQFVGEKFNFSIFRL